MEPIVICDIDGCLNFYPKTFLDWVKINTGICKKDIGGLKSFLAKEEYEKLKYKYRTCGVKRNLVVKKGAVNVLREINELGKKIWLVTTRPTFEPVKRDTRYWLKKNKVIYDKLIFKKKEEKKEYIIKLRKKICFIIEDDLDDAICFAEKVKVPVFLFHNGQLLGGRQHKKKYALITCIKSWHDIKMLLRKPFVLEKIKII